MNSATYDKIRGMQRLLRTFLNLMIADLLVVCFALPGVTLATGSPKNTGRPRITGLDQVTIYVSDIKKSRRFYSDVLGLTAGCRPYSGSDTCFPVRPSEQRIVLKLAPRQIRIDAHKSWLAEVTFATEDVLELRKYLLRHGLQPGPIRKNSDGTQSFRLRDPEGNSVGFVHRPPFKTGYAPSSKQISSRMIHAGFVVKDLAAENHFYVDILGFRLYWRGGFKDDGTDWYELQVPDGPDWIEYMRNPLSRVGSLPETAAILLRTRQLGWHAAARHPAT